jgi:uncharacterized RDD family membrane protein YckC
MAGVAGRPLGNLSGEGRPAGGPPPLDNPFESRRLLWKYPEREGGHLVQTATGTTIYAGFWRRVAAVLVDSLLLSAVQIPLFLAFSEGNPYTDPGGSPSTSTISAVLGWLYYALMESSSKQATVGKMALGIVVTDMDGRRITFGRATGRYFAKILSALILGIGFLMVAFTERKQGLHDLLAKTLVVKGTAPTSVQEPPPPPPMPA